MINMLRQAISLGTIMALVATAAIAQADEVLPVKKSHSDICHCPGGS